MNRLIVLLAVMLLNIQISAGPKPAPHSPQNQMQLTEQACAAYKKADAEMNAAYRKILAENQNERLFAQKLRAAQRAWVIFVMLSSRRYFQLPISAPLMDLFSQCANAWSSRK